jgi:tetratricopeptide (TPR) repeat protein
VDIVDRDEYLRLLAEGFTLADAGDLQEGAARYEAALGSLRAGEPGYSLHHGEYAAILFKLNQHERALEQRRLAIAAAEREGQGDPDPIGVSLARYFLGEQLLSMGRAEEALTAIGASVHTSTSFAGPLMMVHAESLATLGRSAEAKQAAVQAVARATNGQRANIAERLASLLEGT